MGNYDMTMRLKFQKEWRGYRADGTYNVPKPLADILIGRGFAVLSPKPKPKSKRQRVKDNGTNKKP